MPPAGAATSAPTPTHSRSSATPSSPRTSASSSRPAPTSSNPSTPPSLPCKDGFFDYLNTKWFYLTDPNADDIYDALPDLGGRVVSAAMANDYTPLQFIDPATGEAVGWEYDAVTEICARLNCVVEWNNTSWDAMIAAINAGQFDIGMDGITITEERAEQVDFSAPYMTSQQFMLVRADEDRFATPADFAANAELLVGSQAGTVGLLHRRLRHPRRRRSQPAHQALRDLRRIRAGADRRRRGHGARRCRQRARLHRRQPRRTRSSATPSSPRTSASSSRKAPTSSNPSTPPSPRLQEDGFAEHLNTKWFFLYDPNR
jgi:ABC-type amino acid transport substrate-binding protein